MLRAAMRSAVAFTILLGSVVAVAGPASSGSADFELLKEVEGTPPAGTRFSVTISCDGVTIQPVGASDVVVTFAADGTPLTTSALRLEGTGTCTVTETDTGGATSVSYECAQTGGGVGEGGPPPCPAAGPQSSPPVLNVTTPRSPGSVIITNRFAVRAQPDFTG
jgi:hypothetical protein